VLQDVRARAGKRLLRSGSGDASLAFFKRLALMPSVCLFLANEAHSRIRKMLQERGRVLVQLSEWPK